MMMDYTKSSKFISLILRHKPETIGIELDENGWADVTELITGMNKSGNRIDMKILEEIVATNNKKRFIFSNDKRKIRANQGHSIDVDVELKEVSPPEILYHGTAARFKESILEKGLLKQNRNHVHLSQNLETATSVGKRHGKPIIFKIKSKEMKRDGYKFFLSENGVWLTDLVPVKYIDEI